MPRASTALLVLAALGALALPAAAGPTPDPAVTFGSQIQQRSYVSCTNEKECTAAFSAAATGRQIMVTEVSCDAVANSSLAVMTRAELRVTPATLSGTIGRAAYLVPQPQPSPLSQKRTVVNGVTRLVVNAGEAPFLRVTYNLPIASVLLDCTITGTVR